MSLRMVPVFLKPTKARKIVVFGGGNVALRKCKQFEGFHITVVADKTVPGIDEICDEIVLEHFDSSDVSKYIEEAFIVVAATDSKTLNMEINEQSVTHGILSNSAHGGGTVLLPSSVRKKRYTVSVSSEGSVPAFPPYVAEQIDAFLGEEYDLMLDLLMELRKDLGDIVTTQPKRAEYLADIIHNNDIWYMLKNDDFESAMKLAFEIRLKYAG